MKKARIKDILTVETRVSLYQTCMNNSKGRTTRIMMNNAREMYGIAMEDIKEFGGIEIEKLEQFTKREKMERLVTKQDAKKLLRAVMKKQKKSNRKAKK